MLIAHVFYNSLAESDVLNGDIIGMIQPYPTANFWWWPGIRQVKLYVFVTYI